MAPARLVVQLLDGDTVVHEYRRATAQPTAVGIVRMLEAMIGWAQAYAGAVNDAQWANDVLRAHEAQAELPRPLP